MSQSREATEYISRTGRYEDRGDIDRSPTRDDLSLASASDRRPPDGLGLDYMAREGAFAEKGAGRQLDASLWDQDGPVTVRETERRMKEAGGAFVDSFVAIKREHAEALGLDSKESLERLIRRTWSRSVEEWGLVKDPADIRWVAAYHTDADRSLHVHIHTWSAKGEIEPGATIPAEATRRAKEIVYSEGYASIRRERDARATYLRDLSVLEAKRQLGVEIEPGQERRIAERAERAAYPERLSAASELAPADREKVEALRAKLSGELAQGRGRLADNYAAQATARDILRRLEQASPSYAEVSDRYREHARIKAVIKGYANSDARAHREFVRAEEQDRVSRVANAVVRAHLPPRPAPELRPDLARLDMRGVEGRGNISFSDKLVERADEGRLVVRVPYQGPGGREYVSLPAADVAGINRGSGHLAAIDDRASYELTDRSGQAVGSVSGRGLYARFGVADMDRIARFNPSDGRSEGELAREAARRSEARARAERRREEERAALRAAQASLSPSLLREQNAFSVRHGIPLHAAAQMGREASILTSRLHGSGATRYEHLTSRDQQRVDRIAGGIVDKSSRFREALDRTASERAHQMGVGRAEAYSALKDAAVRGIRDEVVARAEAGSFRNSPSDLGPEPAGHVDQMGALEMLDGIAEVACALVQDAGAAAAQARGRERTIQRLPELEREAGR